jgi:hypothetical protein
MTPAEIRALTGRSETWLRGRICVWCEQNLWAALRYGCGAYGEKCNPTKKDYSDAGEAHEANAQ